MFILSCKSSLNLITLVNFLEIYIYILRKDLLELIPKKDVLFFLGDWNAKAKSQEILGVTGKFCFRLQSEAGQTLTKIFQENTLVIANTLSKNTKDSNTHGHHQMVNTRIRLIVFFAAKDGEVIYSQQKQDWELTVAYNMSSLLQNSGLN